MYLKAIEIVGFKSFADKVRLDFEPGITCIVGPNGCGKSNVIDAVRWTIGEMSWKSLRSASMVDIIFNGTAKRAPLNMAQVSMIFDNAARRLPLDFNEINVTRKIFRSGESEYYLNKVQCRLRDIRDLFLDTGIGGEGYAIIDQGGVDSVLSASPEQRREMFEEVAGVSKYKAKREECVRRLERVDLDLARLCDTTALIAEQIKKLDSEAKKARLYQKYREELKESEIAISLCSIKQADEQIAQQSAALTPVETQLSDLENRISAQEGSAAALALNLTHKEKEAADFNAKISASKYQVGLLEGAIKNCDNLTAELTAQIASSGAEAQRGQTRLDELGPAIAKIKTQLAAADKALAPLQEQFNAKSAAAQKAEQDLRNADAEDQRIAQALMDTVQKQMEAQNRIALEQANIRREQEDLIAAEQARQAAEAAQKAVQESLQEVTLRVQGAKDQSEASRQAVIRAEEALQTQRQERVALGEKLSAVKADRAALSAKLEMIQTQGKNDPYWVGVQAVKKAKIAGIKSTLRKALKYPAALNGAVEEAFGKYLDALLCETPAALQKALDVLAAQKNARAKFILLCEVPHPKEKPAGTLAAQLSYPKELEDLIHCLIGPYSYEGGTLKGGFFVGGGDEKVRAPEAYWGEEEAVKEEIAAREKEEETVSRQMIAGYEAITKAEENLKNLRAKTQEVLVALSAVQNEHANKERELKNLQDETARATKRKEQIGARIAQCEQQAQTFADTLAALKKQHEDCTRRDGEIKKLRQELRTQADALKAELATLNTAVYDAKIKKNNIELDLKSTEYEFNTLRENEGKRNAQISSANLRIKSLADEKLSTQAKLSAERDTLARLEKDEHQMRADLEALKKDYSEKSAALDACKKQATQLTLQKNNLENALANARRQRTAVTNNLFEAWNITPEEAQLHYGDKEVDYERVKMMRKRIENMGAINMTAPEEYDALTERNNFLKTQMTDLDEAKKDLKSAINKINQTTRESFTYTFEQVRMHFKHIFSSLFRGGE